MQSEEFTLTPQLLREKADYFCDAVLKHHAEVWLFRCGDCDKPHVRVVPAEYFEEAAE